MERSNESSTNEQTQTNPIKDTGFDGWNLYLQALDALKTRHIGLTDPKIRQEWSHNWEYKYAGSNCLKNEMCTDDAVSNLVKSLGSRFDHYLIPEKIEDDKSDSSESRIGIGTFLAEKNIAKERRVILFDVMEGSPADKAGLRAGDVLLRVDDEDVSSLPLSILSELIKRKEGEVVNLTVEDEDSITGESSFSVTTEKNYEIRSVVSKDLGNGINYVKLREFEPENVAKMKAALMETKSGRGIILDLRKNGGGDAEAALRIAEMFLPEGKYVDEIERRGSNLYSKTILFESDFILDCETGGVVGSCRRKNRETSLTGEKPIVVLVDEDTASAAEILAGVLQKQDGATIVGLPTMGKGEGQVPKRLPEGRTLWITSFFFKPGGEELNWIGILPDIEISAGTKRNMDLQLNEAQRVLEQKILDADSRTERKEELSKRNHQI